MVKKFAYMLVLSIVLTGCSSPNLRVDDFRFGNKRVGLQAENPTFKAGEEVRLTFALRGFTADASGKQLYDVAPNCCDLLRLTICFSLM